MKVVLSFIILNYDFSLAKPNDTRWSTWRSAMIPKTETMVIFTRHDKFNYTGFVGFRIASI